jgi:hypothetical protein
MPGINLRYNKALQCPQCGLAIAAAGEYSTLQSEDGAVLLFNDAAPPKNLVVTLECANGHRFAPPDEIRVQWWFMTDPKTPKATAKAIALRWDQS